MIRVLDGDMRDVVPTLDRIDAVVTDPPYHLTSRGMHMDLRSMPCNGNGTRLKNRPVGFMNQEWDGGDIAFQADTWWPVFTALKPGGHLVAFGSTRTFHRMVCAIEDAGFEIRDTLMWLYGSGFPKSHDISKAIDKAAGAEREVIGVSPRYCPGRKTKMWDGVEYRSDITAPATPEAAQWAGWGTALKPSYEPIILARKPLDGTVAANTLKHGVGGLNIDACRVESGGEHMRGTVTTGQTRNVYGKQAASFVATDSPLGRWPSNCLHDGSDEVLEAFAAYGERTSGKPMHRMHVDPGRQIASGPGLAGGGTYFHSGFGDTGTAARFFYSAKADKADRADSRHPTVKPLDLMVWLTKLVCPPGGTVLDPFAGSGVTAEACMLNGFDCILVEKNPEYCRDIRHRIRRWSGEDCPLFATAAD